MTLYKIFKENEDFLNAPIMNIRLNVGDLEFINNQCDKIYPRHKQSQLAIIDGVIAMVEDMKKEEDINPLNNFYDGVEHGYNVSLSDLKDKLLAERKLIEENK